MSDYWWTLPGPNSFVENIAADLLNGANVAVFRPHFAPEGLDNEVKFATGIGRDKWHAHTIAVESGSLATPIRRLRDILIEEQHQFGSMFSTKTLVEHPDLKDAVVWIDLRETEDYSEWISFASEISSVRRSLSHDRNPLFVFEFEGVVPPPQSDDASLSHHIYEGYCTRFDMQAYILQQSPMRNYSNLVERTIHSCIVELAGWDPYLAESLMGSDPVQVFLPQRHLERFAEERGWSLHHTVEAQQGDQPWASGRANILDGERIEHLSSLVSRNPQVAEFEIRRRIWVGQVSQVLPFIEHRRLDLLNSYRDCFQIPYQAIIGQSTKVIERIDDLEINHMSQQIHSGIADLARDISERIRLWTSARNQLAHLSALGLDDLRQLEESRLR